MSEKGILFKGEMVRAILAGRKDRTRRQPHLVDAPVPKPKFAVGDLLWVRETYHIVDCPVMGKDIVYKATEPENFWPLFRPWKPSLFMPKHAARIWLRVTEVKRELLQDISEEEAKREGTTLIRGKTYKESFEVLWNEINAPRGFGWNVPQYVYEYTFERVEK